MDWSNRAAAVRFCGDLYNNIVTGAAIQGADDKLGQFLDQGI
jgi:hypothetical protein